MPPPPRRDAVEGGRLAALVNRFLGDCTRADRRVRRTRRLCGANSGRKTTKAKDEGENATGGSQDATKGAMAGEEEEEADVRARGYDIWAPKRMRMRAGGAAKAEALLEEEEARRMATAAARASDESGGGVSARALLEAELRLRAGAALPARAGLGATVEDCEEHDSAEKQQELEEAAAMAVEAVAGASTGGDGYMAWRLGKSQQYNKRLSATGKRRRSRGKD
jgi:hypothetical protein